MIAQVLSELGLEAAKGAMVLGERWEEVVGAEAARHSRPLGVRGRVLEAEVDSSVWCQQLQMERPRLLAALREVLGDDAPADVRFRVGYNRSR